MSPLARSRSPLAIITDFGYRDHYVGAMKGVIASIAPDVPVIDITHAIPPQAIIAGAIVLRETWRYFPPRTIFLTVIDPGVGTARAPIAIETRAGARFVGPDNGVLWLAASEAGIKRIVKLTSTRHRLSNASATFHGRDIFAPAAAHLARGTPLSSLGPALRSIVHVEMPHVVQSSRELRGEVIYVDAFGNLITNIDRDRIVQFNACFRDKSLSVRIKAGTPAIRIVNTYAAVPKGAPLATFGSFGLLEVAIRDANAATHFGAGPGSSVSVVGPK